MRPRGLHSSLGWIPEQPVDACAKADFVKDRDCLAYSGITWNEEKHAIRNASRLITRIYRMCRIINKHRGLRAQGRASACNFLCAWTRMYFKAKINCAIDADASVHLWQFRQDVIFYILHRTRGIQRYLVKTQENFRLQIKERRSLRNL